MGALRIGFTGTREGMTTLQRRAFVRLLLDKDPEPLEFHHGDCVGSDHTANDVVHIYAPLCTRIAHPPNSTALQAHATVDIILEAKYYIDRNHDIVEATDELIATPKESSEIRKSGTWATIRYARKLGKKVTIIYPDGTLGN